MREIINIDFNRAAREMSSSEVFGNELIVTDLQSRKNDKQRLENAPAIRLEAVSFFICTQGQIEFHVDYKDYRLHKNMLLQLNNIHILENVRMDSQYEGYLVAISPKLTQHIMWEVYTTKKLSAKLERHSPLVTLSEVETMRLIEIILRIVERLKETDHYFQQYILKNEVSNFLLETANINIKQNEAKEQIYNKIDYREEIAQRFLHLVHTNCKEEHEVSFYSNKLGMSTGNLSRILNEISGKSAIKWISDILIMESKILLQKPGMNIQQVSEALHFTDQSSFGRFFKKHTGLKPMEFKNKAQKG